MIKGDSCLKKTKIKIIFKALPALALVLLSGGSGHASDNFLHPEKNTYSLKNIFTRPYLQSHPIGPVWTAGAGTEAFRRALLNALTPRTRQERLLAALFWGEEAQNNMDWFEKTEQEDMKEATGALIDTLDELYPISEEVMDSFAQSAERSDLKTADDLLLTHLDMDSLKQDMDDLYIYMKSIDRNLRTELEIDVIERALSALERRRQKEVYALLLDDNDTIEKSLEVAEDIFLIEGKDNIIQNEMEQLLWSLLVNDMMDIGSTLDFGKADLLRWEKQNLDLPELYSPLDIKVESKQIQDETDQSKREGFFRIFKKIFSKKENNGTQTD